MIDKIKFIWDVILYVYYIYTYLSNNWDLISRWDCMDLLSLFKLSKGKNYLDVVNILDGMLKVIII